MQIKTIRSHIIFTKIYTIFKNPIVVVHSLIPILWKAKERESQVSVPPGQFSNIQHPDSKQKFYKG